MDLIREDGLHPVNVQGRSRAVVVYSHYPSEFLHEDLFEPHLWVNGQSLLQPQESQVPALVCGVHVNLLYHVISCNIM